MFILQNAPTSELELAGVKLSMIEIDNQTAKFDLLLSMQEDGDELGGVLEYNTDLFEASTIARLANHFQTLLEGVVCDPQQHVDDLPLLSAAERTQTVVEWNDTAAAFPNDVCLPELFAAQVARTPDAIAVQFEDAQLSYAELHARSNQLAHHLVQLRVTPESLVGICLERGLDMVVALLATLKTGAAYVPLDPAYPRQRLALVLEDSGVNVLLTHEHLRPQLPADLNIVSLDSDWAAITAQNDLAVPARACAGNLAYVIYTSGSTGRPMGVQI
jgi:non-ribosomal peptide synthetase component F